MHFWFAALAVALISLAAIFRLPLWPGEMLLSLAPQIGAGGLLLGVLFFRLGRPGPGLLLIACAATCFFFSKEAFEWRRASIDDPTLKIVWANVFMTMDSFEKALTLAQNEQADIVVIAETPRSLPLDEVKRQFTDYGFVRGRAAGENAAISIFSKRPIENFTILPVEGRKSVVFDARLGDAQVTIGAVHPPTPSTPRKMRVRDAHILATAEALSDRPNRILIGDFNTVPWSPLISEAQKLGGVNRMAASAPSTWMSAFPVVGLPIDLVLTDDTISVSARVGPATGSDHLPLIIEFALDKEQTVSN